MGSSISPKRRKDGPNVGDRIMTPSRQVGIVCHLDPPIVRLETFHCYAIFDTETVTIVDRDAQPEEPPPKPALLSRIVKYAESHRETPTGG